MWWWRRKGAELVHAHIDWFDGQSLDDKVNQLEKQVHAMLERCGGVALIGSSAGGSLALHTFHALREENVCVVAAHARLKVGDYTNEQRASLYHRARMDTSRSSQAFFDSVTRAEAQVIPALTENEKARMLTLSSVTDIVVPPSLMTIEGVANHQSLAFGHAGGFVAHLLADRDIILNFARDRLNG